MNGGYPHKTIILQIYLWLSNQLIQYHQVAKNHLLGLNFGNISIEAFALTINARKGFFTINLQPQLIHFFHNPPINFFELFRWWCQVIQYFWIGSNGFFIIRKINVYFVSGLGRSPSSPTLSSKTNKEPAVVALPLVVHEDTIGFNCTRGPMVHLFGSELEVFMISWIISFSGWGSS